MRNWHHHIPDVGTSQLFSRPSPTCNLSWSGFTSWLNASWSLGIIEHARVHCHLPFTTNSRIHLADAAFPVIRFAGVIDPKGIISSICSLASLLMKIRWTPVRDVYKEKGAENWIHCAFVAKTKKKSNSEYEPDRQLQLPRIADALPQETVEVKEAGCGQRILISGA